MQQGYIILRQAITIFAEAVAEHGRDVRARLPCEEIKKRSLRYLRDPPSPQGLRDLELPEEWCLTGGVNLEPFLIYDNGTDAECRILAFATEHGLQWVAAAETLFMDETFGLARHSSHKSMFSGYLSGMWQYPLYMPSWRGRIATSMANSSSLSPTLMTPFISLWASVVLWLTSRMQSWGR